ncbi:MAG: tRNA lysidine(34) synthetase TilS [Sphingomonadales bacterium]|nr:MAG: tRNA lysidine(34) synthetase TilS [Sphingomonadales bacterium]
MGVAVSGGPDSLALLLLAHAANPDRVAAATVDHGLRAESAGEAAMVAELCARIGVPHTVLKIEVPHGNLQHEARHARYNALGEWMNDHRLEAVMTAHHADDQAETFLMRLNRGSGLAGLSGIRAVRTIPGGTGTLVRPLLGWRKAELEAIVRGCGIKPVLDPSNTDDRFDRARIRKALAEADWLDVAAVARSASLLAEAEALLLEFVDQEWSAQVAMEDSAIRYLPGQERSDELHVRIIDRAIRQLGGEARLSQIATLLQALKRGESGNIAGVLVRAKKGEWVFSPEPPRNQGAP